MTRQSLTATLGMPIQSVAGWGETLTAGPPWSLTAMLAGYLADRTINHELVTPAGVALGGQFTLTLRHDGTWSFSGYFDATGLASYTCSLLVSVAISIPNPAGGAAFNTALTFGAHGKAHGKNEPGAERYEWDQNGVQPLIAAYWALVRQAPVESRLKTDADFLGPIGDVAVLLGEIALWMRGG